MSTDPIAKTYAEIHDCLFFTECYSRNGRTYAEIHDLEALTFAMNRAVDQLRIAFELRKGLLKLITAEEAEYKNKRGAA